MSRIVGLFAREILDSRGMPTIATEVTLDNGVKAIGMVPSGASVGSKEAVELRDQDSSRYGGKGVLKAIDNVHKIIKPALINSSVMEQYAIDNRLLELDIATNKSNLGANAILSVSLAVALAAAKCLSLEPYEYFGKYIAGFTQWKIPVPLINVINGGMHANNNCDIQEFMIVPLGFDSYSDALRCAVEIFYALRKLLQDANISTSVGDEGGFTPNIKNHCHALDFIMQAIELAGYRPQEQVMLALDIAASELYNNGIYHLKAENLKLDSDQFIKYLEDLVNHYPIISIEDGLSDNDWHGWHALTIALGERVQLVGDDLFVTNTNLLRKGFDQGIANAILLKMNQVGTLKETFDVINFANKEGFNCVVSHRSGETIDTTIADLAVAAATQIKAGSVCRGERIAKYNRLLAIEQQIGQNNSYVGRSAFSNILGES